jgi:hypothetical protein
MSVEIVHLGYSSKARVWLGELPDCAYPSGKILEAVQEQETQSSSQAEPSCAAVEAMLVRGPRVLYGLLGASFTPDESQRCVVQVGVDTAFERPANWMFPEYSREQTRWALATNLDSIYIGLLEEYAPAVLRGSVHAGEVLGGGLLRFDCAAHGLVGSSEWLFQNLADLLVVLLARTQRFLNLEDLTMMLTATFTVQPT